MMNALQKKYAVGVRNRFNMTDYDYTLVSRSWPTDRFNGCQRDVLTAGYGRQFHGPA